MTDYGWHLVNNRWILGLRNEREGEVTNPQAVIEKRSNKWYWRTFISDDWHPCDSFSEATVAASYQLKDVLFQ